MSVLLRSICSVSVLLLTLISVSVSANTVLVVGDSISAGYGVDTGKGWVDLLAERLRARNAGWRVVNASVSGDTTSGGAARIDAALAEHTPRVVILELGGNDALRGQPVTMMRDNLALMVQRSRSAGARVLLLGMRIPPNYGPAYTKAFSELYRSLASTLDVALVSFLLEDVALDDRLMQPDGIHPTTQAQPIMLETVWPTLERLIADVERAG